MRKVRGHQSHSLRTVGTRGNFKVERCSCGHVRLSIGFTAITLDLDAVGVVVDLLGRALAMDTESVLSPTPPGPGDELH